MRFSPPLIPTALAVPAVVLLVGLGNWQVRRNGETQQTLATMAARLEAPPVRSLDEAEPGRRATLAGSWASSPLLAGRVRFDQLGYEVFQALETAEGRVLVDRGWVPVDAHDDVPMPDGTHTITGLIRETGGRTEVSAQPPSDGIPELWPLTATAAIASSVDADPAHYLHAGDPLPEGRETRPDVLPVGGWHAMPTTRPHLAYAATWYASALFVVGIWVVLGVRRGRED